MLAVKLVPAEWEGSKGKPVGANKVPCLFLKWQDAQGQDREWWLLLPSPPDLGRGRAAHPPTLATISRPSWPQFQEDWEPFPQLCSSWLAGGIEPWERVHTFSLQGEIPESDSTLVVIEIFFLPKQPFLFQEIKASGFYQENHDSPSGSRSSIRQCLLVLFHPAFIPAEKNELPRFSCTPQFWRARFWGNTISGMQVNIVWRRTHPCIWY